MVVVVVCVVFLLLLFLVLLFLLFLLLVPKVKKSQINIRMHLGAIIISVRVGGWCQIGLKE